MRSMPLDWGPDFVESPGAPWSASAADRPHCALRCRRVLAMRRPEGAPASGPEPLKAVEEAEVEGSEVWRLAPRVVRLEAEVLAAVAEARTERVRVEAAALRGARVRGLTAIAALGWRDALHGGGLVSMAGLGCGCEPAQRTSACAIHRRAQTI